ncbi:MAG: type II toxin-antitoxin system RelE/ParE family toxin [Gammaproteobacteria bacterium]
MKIYKTHVFDKWIKKEGITNSTLQEAIDEMCDGIIDADLGGGLVKKRMAKPGHGKRGSYRILLAFRSNSRAIFLTGFSKSDMDNITSDEKAVFKKLCTIYLNMDCKEIESMCKAKKLIEVTYEKD